MENNDNILGIREIQSIYEINDRQQEAMEHDIQSIEYDMQLRTMSVDMCKTMEKYIGLKGQDDDTVEEKRFRIQGAENERTPYTFEILKARLNEMVGRDRVLLSIDDGILVAKVALESKKSVGFINDLLDQMVPLDVMIETNMIWNTYQKLNEYTYEYLGRKTCREVKEEVL